MFLQFLRVLILFFAMASLFADDTASVVSPEITSDQWAKISFLSQNINETQDSNELVKWYNERGIAYLFLEKYDQALNDFNYILKFSETDQSTQKKIFGAALWGRFFCHAYQNMEDEAFEDLNLIYSYFLSNSACNGSFLRNEKYYFSNTRILSAIPRDNILLVANFENPNERISSAECRDRVVGTANLMRLLVSKIKKPSLVAAAEYAISELERICCNCCDRKHWTECLNPITDAWIYVKECMAKGVALAPRVICPGR